MKRRDFLKIVSGSAALAPWADALALSACVDDDPAPERRPNIIFFFIDDMGWQDTSVPFHSERTKLNDRYRTPNMERLAKEGMKFTQAYACAVCSPSRISLMTGMNAARHMVTNWTLRKGKQPDRKHPRVRAADWNLNGLSPSGGVERTVCAVTLPMLLRQAGYRTIHCGKAHFGADGTPGADPCNLGFDRNVAGHAAGGPGSYHGTHDFSAAWRKGGRIWDVPGLEKYHGKEINLTEALTREAVSEIERSLDENVPFYLYMSHYAIHAPWEEDDRFLQRYVDAGLEGMPAVYASMIESMDRSLGDLMACLERRGALDDTIVIFMSDNGQPSQAPRNEPLRGHKLTPYEGGVRVPLLVRWPGVVKPATVCEDRYVIIEDIFPTILEMAGVRELRLRGGTIDGVSFVPLLREEPGYPEKRPVFWHYPNTYDQPPYSAVRQGRWKLIHHHATRKLELFDLEADIGEEHDLSHLRCGKASELAGILSDFLRETGAGMTVDLSTGKPVEYPDQVMVRNPHGITGADVPVSTIAASLVFCGKAISEPDWTLWGAAPIEGPDGKTHLFAARWPEKNVDPAWRRSSEIAHYVAERPEGPFIFKETVLEGTGRRGEWDAFAPSNPEIRRFGETYALVYIANSDYRQPPHPLNQSIGMVVSRSLDGPWRKVGENGQILDASAAPSHWTHGRQVVNPALIRHNGKYLLYFKSRFGKGTGYGIAASDRLEGPYVMQERPVTTEGVFIEDATVFSWQGRICLLTTDNHGKVTGIRGGGALWYSDDGLRFDPAETELGYDRLPRYLPLYRKSRVKRIYGGDPKLERPKILMRSGEPAYLYAPSGWNVTGGQRTETYVFRIDR